MRLIEAYDGVIEYRDLVRLNIATKNTKRSLASLEKKGLIKDLGVDFERGNNTYTTDLTRESLESSRLSMEQMDRAFSKATEDALENFHNLIGAKWLVQMHDQNIVYYVAQLSDLRLFDSLFRCLELKGHTEPSDHIETYRLWIRLLPKLEGSGKVTRFKLHDGGVIQAEGQTIVAKKGSVWHRLDFIDGREPSPESDQSRSLRASFFGK